MGKNWTQSERILMAQLSRAKQEIFELNRLLKYATDKLNTTLESLDYERRSSEQKRSRLSRKAD